MHNIAYMFPGQGAQYKGMGKELFNSFPNETKKANQVLGYDLVDLCLNDLNGNLNNTKYTQPAIYFVSCLSYLGYTNENVNDPLACVLGHSVGEYAALFAASIFDLYTGLRIVQKRGELMAKIHNGSMIAVIGDNISTITLLLEENNLNNIDVANFNSFTQVVLSGIEQDIIRAKEILEHHNYRCVELNVSGAFHSRQMEPARLEFMRFLMNFEFNTPKIPVISTTTASLLEKDYILETLGFQLVKSVKWLQTILYLRSLSIEKFIELGPSDILTKLNTKIFGA